MWQQPVNYRRKKYSKRNKVTRFIGQLYGMLEQESHLGLVSWTTEADSFFIRDIAEFTQRVLPIYFKHQNYHSFLRQLYMYNFSKVRSFDQRCSIYQNSLFAKGNVDMLQMITRQHPNKNSLPSQKRKTRQRYGDKQQNIGRQQHVRRELDKDKSETMMVPSADRQLGLYSGSGTMSGTGSLQKSIHQLNQQQIILREQCLSLLDQNSELLANSYSIQEKLFDEQAEKHLLFRRLRQFIGNCFAEDGMGNDYRRELYRLLGFLQENFERTLVFNQSRLNAILDNFVTFIQTNQLKHILLCLSRFINMDHIKPRNSYTIVTNQGKKIKHRQIRRHARGIIHRIFQEDFIETMKGSIVVSGATDTIGVTLAAAEGVKTVNTFGLETVNTFGVPITPDPICLTQPDLIDLYCSL